jgi:carbon-monoxide dehydrogenase medium subunit
VKPAAFAYAKAKSVAHAIELLGHTDGARIIAGGQTLLAALNMRLDAPSLLVDLNGILGLDGIVLKHGQVEVGALTRHAIAERSEVVARHAPLIARAVPHIGHPAIRNRGTIGGSIANADPAAELPACLVALRGEIDINGPDGARTVTADSFFKDLFETELGAWDVLTAIRVPAATPDTRVGFAEFCRRHGDYAIVGLAACGHATGKALADVRLAYFGVGATPVRAHKAEAVLSGAAIDDKRIAQAVAALADDLAPQGDLNASAEVRKHLAGVLLKRVARQLAEPL